MRPAPIAAVALALLAMPAGAQSGLGAGSGLLSQLGGKAGGLGALGGGLPDIGGAGSGNVAGLLGYCLKNRLLGPAGTAAGPTSAGGVLGKLTARPGVNTSQGFLAGQQGVLSSGGTALPIGSLGDTVKQRLCASVLGRAKGLLGR